MTDPDTPREATAAEIARLVEGFAKARASRSTPAATGRDPRRQRLPGAPVLLLTGPTSAPTAMGAPKNRIRFAVEVAEAVAAEVGPEHTAIRISPWPSTRTPR